MYFSYCRRIMQTWCCEEGLLEESLVSLLFKSCQLLQYLIGNMQVALPGWWVRNLSSANKNVVSTQAETSSVYIWYRGERRRNLLQRPPIGKSIYLKSIPCRPILGLLGGLQDDALNIHSIESRADPIPQKLIYQLLR